MFVEMAIVVGASFVTAAILTGAIRGWALRNGLMDIPNHRSSHELPIPRGGGLAMVATAAIGWGWLAYREILSANFVLALAGGGIAVAAIGYLDDRRQVSASARFLVHLAAAAWALFWMGGVPPPSIPGLGAVPGWLLQAIGAVAIVWVINLFNFMDGIDGIAASEAVFVTVAGACLSVIAGSAGQVPAASLVVSAASCGFLCWNWPRARIFMGDVGSGFLGFAIAVSALASARENPAMLLVWLLLGGAFFVDATVTLVRRLARGERVHQAHRTHAYQWLSRRWGSHRKVTCSVLAVNVIWLLPLAWSASRFPAESWWLAIVALLPLVVAALLAGAGRPE